MASSEIQVVQLTDRGGNTLRVKSYQGRLWPDFPSESIKGVETLTSRDDDIILVSYPKSGSHWLWEIMCMLLTGTTDKPVAEKEVGMIGLVPPEQLEVLPSPRVLNTHAHFELMPREVLDKKNCKLIYVTRDPRDVAVSYYNNHKKLVQYYSYTGQWKDYFSLYLNGQGLTLTLHSEYYLESIILCVSTTA
ncbi:sulfotransferase 1A2 [Elysia marginata]|uniref:Sulfotransferase 1A2 n=1 Tax=Elysia marginata TaxID=1093978 RepID=A0AAV4JM12_9GAST|nr:sulfotransferase 1A2 [Elysia marginata]